MLLKLMLVCCGIIFLGDVSHAQISCTFDYDYCGWRPTPADGVWMRTDQSINGVRPPLAAPSRWQVIALSNVEQWAELTSPNISLVSQFEFSFYAVQQRAEFTTPNPTAELLLVPADGSPSFSLWSTKWQASYTSRPITVILHRQDNFFLRFRFKVGNTKQAGGITNVKMSIPTVSTISISSRPSTTTATRTTTGSLITPEITRITTRTTTSTRPQTDIAVNSSPTFRSTTAKPTTTTAPYECPTTQSDDDIHITCVKTELAFSTKDFNFTDATKVTIVVDQSRKCINFKADAFEWLLNHDSAPGSRNSDTTNVHCSKGQLEFSETDASISTTLTLVFSIRSDLDCRILFKDYLTYLNELAM